MVSGLQAVLRPAEDGLKPGHQHRHPPASPPWHRRAAGATEESAHPFGVRRAIITKFDATKRVGAALTAAHAAALTLAHFSESAFISDGLLPASPEFLARRLLASRPGKIG